MALREGPTPARFLPEGLVFCVEGNIGCGKSTLVKALMERVAGSGVNVVEEPVDQWVNHNGKNYLELSYTDPAGYAVPFQNLVFDSYVNVRRLQNPDIMERSPMSATRVFCAVNGSRGLIPAAALPEMLTRGEAVMRTIATRPVFVYLELPPEECLRRMRRRDRTGEAGVGLDYLCLLHERYEAWLSSAEDVERVDASLSREEIVDRVIEILCRRHPRLRAPLTRKSQL
ncbi:ORF5R [Ictalurid herpesvirus 1]|nr:ORF5L [Ictalurid herpesvirus 1]QAB08566.1 ORF5R [Ictalurid herpesvirus 1]